MIINYAELDVESLAPEHLADALYRLLRFQYSSAKYHYVLTEGKAERLVRENKRAEEDFRRNDMDECVGFGFGFVAPHKEDEIEAARELEEVNARHYEEAKAMLDMFVRHFIKEGMKET